jgi:hypothetical protein
MIGSKRSRTLGAALLWTVAASPGVAQRVDPARIIDFHVNAEQPNLSFSAAIHEGGRFRLTTPNRGTYGISVVLLDAAQERFSVSVFQGEGPGDTTTYRLLETVGARAHVPAPLHSIPYVTVVVDGTRSATALAPFGRQFELAAYVRHVTAPVYDDFCCVSCQGYIACGCAVSMSCGYCCTGDCCAKMPAPPPEELVHWFPDRPIGRPARRCKEVPASERIYPQFAPTERIASR